MTLDTTQTLRTHDFVAGMGQASIEMLAAIAHEVTFEEDEVVLNDGERSAALYLLTSGSVAVELRTPRYCICVESLGSGQVFGWSSLLDQQDTLFQVRARERSTALRLDGAALQRLCRREPGIGTELLMRTLRVVAGRVKATEIRFAEMCGMRV